MAQSKTSAKGDIWNSSDNLLMVRNIFFIKLEHFQARQDHDLANEIKRKVDRITIAVFSPEPIFAMLAINSMVICPKFVLTLLQSGKGFYLVCPCDWEPKIAPGASINSANKRFIAVEEAN